MLHLVLYAALLATAADAPADEQLTSDVRRLVRALNAQQLTERDEAEKALLALGPAALPLLPEVNERTPAEVSQRLARVRQALQMAAVEIAGKPSRVTLKGTLPLAEVLAAISKQTGNRIVDHRENFGEEVTDPQVTVDFADTPFWNAIDNVLDQAELAVYGFTGERGVFLVNRPKGQLPRSSGACISGPFRLNGTRFEAVRDLRSPKNKSLKLFMQVEWEPRLKPVGLMQPLDTIKVAASGGENIAVDGAQGVPEAQVGEDTCAVELEIPLELPARKVEKIDTLSGKLNAIVPGMVETFRFAELPILKDGKAKKVEQRKAGVTVAVDQVRKNNEIWEVRMRVKFDNPSQALESHRTWVLNNEAYLEGTDGKRIDHGGFEQTRQTKDEIGMLYLFELEKGPQALTFVYKTPVAILEMPMEYELQDLQLP